jgi:maltodextrin utilization protein YvdJ
LSDSISSIDLKVLDLETNSDVAAEIGPLKYVAKITGKDTDIVVNWFILLFIFVFDPLAIMLLVSANKALRIKKPKENIYGEIKITKKNKTLKPIKNNSIEEDIQKEQAIRKQIQKVSNSSMSESRRNTQIKNLEQQIPKKDNNLSKEY